MADLVSMAVLGTAVTGVLGWAMIRLLRQRSEALDLFTLSAVTVSAMAAGALTAGKAMYLSGHDLVVVLVVLAGGAAVSLLTAWLLGQRGSAARKRARAHEAARRELIAWLSEDLRAPLTSLHQTLDRLDDGHPLRSDIDRLTELADDLLEISRS